MGPFPVFTFSKWDKPIFAFLVYLAVSGVVANAYGLVRLICWVQEHVHVS